MCAHNFVSLQKVIVNEAVQKEISGRHAVFHILKDNNQEYGGKINW